MGYPLPCSFCNMMAQDENINGDCFEEQDWVKDGKMVIHFPDCPARPGAYPRTIARRAARTDAEGWQQVATIWKRTAEILRNRPRGPIAALGKLICDLLDI